MPSQSSCEGESTPDHLIVTELFDLVREFEERKSEGDFEIDG